MNLFKRWIREDNAVAAIEAGILFPIMMSIMMSVVDLGAALTVNMKLVNSTHMLADLLAREEDVNDTEFNDAVVAAQLAIQPYNTAPLGYDVVGIQFVGASMDPTVIWRDVFNMAANNGVLTDSAGLGIEDEGVIAVTLMYQYQPFFTGFVIGAFDMEEVSIARGRQGLFVTRST